MSWKRIPYWEVFGVDAEEAYIQGDRLLLKVSERKWILTTYKAHEEGTYLDGSPRIVYDIGEIIAEHVSSKGPAPTKPPINWANKQG